MKEHPNSKKMFNEFGTVIYTAYTEGSTNARTMYSIPAESDIDNDD